MGGGSLGFRFPKDSFVLGFRFNPNLPTNSTYIHYSGRAAPERNSNVQNPDHRSKLNHKPYKPLGLTGSQAL